MVLRAPVLNKRFLFYILYVLLCLLGVLFALEVLLRCGAIKNKYILSITELEWRDSGYIYLHPPFQEFTFRNEDNNLIAVKADRFGLRNPDSVYDASSSKCLVLGDSFVEALNTEMDQSFVARLNQLSTTAKPGLVFINGGVSGYANWQSFLLMGKLYPWVKPETVILMVYLGNDLRDNYLIKQAAVSQIKEILKGSQDANLAVVPSRRLKAWLRNNFIEKSKVLKILYAYLEVLRQGFSPAMRYDYFSFETYRNNPKPFVQEAVKNTEFILGAFKIYCYRNNMRLAVIVFPSKEQLEGKLVSNSNEDTLIIKDLSCDPDGYSLDRPRRYYSDICARLGIRFYDLTPIFKQSKETKLFGQDEHWTAAGQKEAASFVFNVIKAQAKLGNN